jgi:hypothetical protein
MRLRRLSLLAIGFVVATGVGVALGAGAILPFSGDGNTINACYTSTGDVKLLTPARPKCQKGYSPISWNVTGPPGEEGKEGPKGDPGEEGKEGPKGDPGTGLTSFGQVEGLPCTTGGEAGTISLSYDETGRATIRCAVSGVVTVSEVATRTETSISDSFVEVRYIGGNIPVDVSGWKLVYLTSSGVSFTLATFPEGTLLAPGAFVLFGGSAYSGAHPADFSYTRNLASAGGAVGIGLNFGTSAEVLVDSVAWGDATNAFVEGSPATAPPVTTPGSSIVRLPDGHDTDDNAADFSVTSTRTPGGPNQ